jgi:hypothetical protein
LTAIEWILIAAVLASLAAMIWQSRTQRAVTAAFSVKSLEASRVECEKSRIAAEASAAEAERSRALIQEQLRVSEIFARYSHRPWLYVNPIDIEIRGLTRAHNPSLLFFSVENGGGTPAIDVRLYFQCAQAMVFKFDPDSVPGDRETTAMIGPHSKLRATVKFEAENEAPVSNYYFFGYARYRDVFGEEHQTTWCYRYNPARSVFEPHKQFNSVS